MPDLNKAGDWAHYPLKFPCPCMKFIEDVYGWVHHGCGGTIHIHMNGDLRCISCETTDFIQKWLFLCIHETKKNPEGEWKKFLSIGELFAAAGKGATSMTKAGADANELGKLLTNL